MLLQFRFQFEHLLLEVADDLVALVFLQGHLLENLDELQLVFVGEVAEQNLSLLLHEQPIPLLFRSPFLTLFLLPILPMPLVFVEFQGVTSG